MANVPNVYHLHTYAVPTSAMFAAARLLCRPPTSQAITTMMQMPRDSQNIQQPDRATGAQASSGPCGSATRPDPHSPSSANSTFYVFVAGFWQSITNPRFGEGPSFARAVPGPNYVWLNGDWCPVMNRPPYAVAATSMPYANPVSHPVGVPPAGPTLSMLQANPVQPCHTRANSGSYAAAAREIVAVVMPPTAGRQGANHASNQSPRRSQADCGYQVLLFGPRTSAMSVSQVRLAGKDVESASIGMPADFLSGQARWVRCDAIKFDVPASTVQH